MPAESPLFTLEEVNALLPRLKRLVAEQMERRSSIEDHLGELAKTLGTLPDTMDLEDSDSPRVRALKRELVERIEAYQSAWREVEVLGAVLKDPREGLLDFQGQVDGKRVWLCWKFGEDAVTHYHSLESGFAGRRPIEPEMRRRHLN
jgi:hypothetical protein